MKYESVKREKRSRSAWTEKRAREKMRSLWSQRIQVKYGDVNKMLTDSFKVTIKISIFFWLS